MSRIHIIKALGSLVSIISAGASVRYPQYAAEFAGLSGVVLGWLHLPQPGST